MDKSDLDFLINSQDTDLLYMHILKTICSNSCRIRDGINRYIIDKTAIHSLSTCVIYCTRYHITDIGRIDKYVMELQ